MEDKGLKNLKHIIIGFCFYVLVIIISSVIFNFVSAWVSVALTIISTIGFIIFVVNKLVSLNKKF